MRKQGPAGHLRQSQHQFRLSEGQLVQWQCTQRPGRKATSPPVSRSRELRISSLMHPILFFFKLEKKRARINSVWVEASQKSHQSRCRLLFCFCARQRCQLPLEFLHLRELLRLTALPRDPARSSCGCELFKSTLCSGFGTCTSPSEGWSLSPADSKTHLASSSILPKSGWSSARRSSAFFLLHKPFNSFWCDFLLLLFAQALWVSK